MARITYLVVGHIVGMILGIVVLGILLIVGLGWAALGWGLLVYGAFLVAGIVMLIFDPYKLDY